jgi:hypothetical protein
VFLLNENGEPLNGGISITPELHDLDGDNDLDLLIGTRSSGVFMIHNIGTRDIPEWSATRVALKTISNKKIKGSNAHLADINGDGLLDISCGNENGGGVYYLNTSASQDLQFADSQVLFQPTPWDERETQPGVRPGARTKMHVADYNGDGKADVLVGDVTWEEYLLPPLSEAKEKEKREFKPQYEAAKAENDRAWDERNSYVGKAGGIPDDVIQRCKAADAKFAPFNEQWYSYNLERTRTHGYVWVVYQK